MEYVARNEVRKVVSVVFYENKCIQAGKEDKNHFVFGAEYGMEREIAVSGAECSRLHAPESRTA
jgi:hypothetical protein